MKNLTVCLCFLCILLWVENNNPLATFELHHDFLEGSYEGMRCSGGIQCVHIA